MSGLSSRQDISGWSKQLYIGVRPGLDRNTWRLHSMLDWHVQNDNWDCRLCGVSCQLAQLGDRPVVMSMQCRFHRSRRRLLVLRCRQIQSNIGVCCLRKLRCWKVQGTTRSSRSRGDSYVQWNKLRLRLHSVLGCDIGQHLRRYW